MKTYFPTINLLRGVAAFMVCLFHFIGYNDFRGDLFSNNSFISQVGEFGKNGVYVFFVISGFVIPLSLYKENFKLKNLPQFLSRRLVRIEIPYFVSILLILMVGFLFAIKNNLNYSINIEQFIYHILYVIPFSKFEWYNVIYWTLAIEFQFYISIGLLYFFLSSNKKVIIFALLIFGLSNFITSDNRLIFYYTTIFLQGIILFLIKTQKIATKLGFALIASCVIATYYLHSLEIAIFSLLTVLTIHFFEINKKLTNRFGNISYSLYLTHGIIGGNVLYFFSRYTNTILGKIFLLIISLILSITISYIFWKLIENPSRKLSGKMKN